MGKKYKLLTPEEASIEEFPIDAKLLDRFEVLEMINLSGGEEIKWRPKVCMKADEDKPDEGFWGADAQTMLKMQAMLKPKGWSLEQIRSPHGYYVLKLTPDPDRITAVHIKKPSAIRMCIIKVLRFLAGKR